MKTKICLFGLCLSVLGGSVALAKTSDVVLSARPVEDIGAKVATPGHGAFLTRFRPGEIRLRLPSCTLDLDLGELQSVRYLKNTDGDADPDDCKVVTVHGDVLVGRCPFKEFLRLLKSSSDWSGDDSVPGAISFSHSTDDVPKPDGLHVLKLANGSLLHVRPRFDSLDIDTGNGSVSVPYAWMASIVRDAGTDLLRISLADAPYALQGYLPRAPLQAGDARDRTLSFPWKDVLSLSLSGSPDAAPARTVQAASVTVLTNGAPLAVPVEFPVSVLPFRSAIGDIAVPSTRLVRAVRNPDRTWTLFTAAGGILTGRLSLPDIELASGGEVVSLQDAVAVEFGDHATPDLPPEAMAWRLDSGDILVGTWEDEPESEPAAAPVAAPSRIAAVRSASTAPAGRTPPKPSPDGTWPLRRYTVRPALTGMPVEIPSKSLEAVCFLPVSDLPPALVPSGPSAFASDEVEFAGGDFLMGRTRGEGAPDELPAVEIRVAPFRLAATPVTLAQFRAFVDDTGYATTAERMSDSLTWRTPGFPQADDEPVVCVSWLDAAHYCNWRSKRARLSPAYDIRDGGRRAVLRPDADGYRLPLEAEWEFAARDGGRDILFPWGDDDSEGSAVSRANFTPAEIALDPWPHTNPVKAFPADPNRLYGMAGNVGEWCQDLYAPRAYATVYRSGAIDRLLNPESGDFPGTGIQRVIRGGSYFNPLASLRCTARAWGPESMSRPRIGMRLARNAD
jgi:formylglycine-generating enzyme required for sulfatase activity